MKFFTKLEIQFQTTHNNLKYIYIIGNLKQAIFYGILQKDISSIEVEKMLVTS